MARPLPVQVVVGDPTRSRAIERTRNGLLLLVAAVLFLWVPVIQYVGLFLGGIGAVLMIFGTKPFGPEHKTLVYGSVVAFVIAYVIEFSLATIFVSDVLHLGPATGPAAASAFLAAWDGLAEGTLVAETFLAISYALIAYGLEDVLGRVLLVAAIGLQILISAYLLVAVVYPILWTAAYQAFASSPVDTGILERANAQLQSLSGLRALNLFPAVLFAVSYLWARGRISRGFIPAPRTAHAP